MRKTGVVTWKEIHVSALSSQAVSNDVIVDWLIFLYSSATSTRNYKEKKKRTFNYPNSSSAIQPVPHTEDLPVPVPTQQYTSDSDDKITENWEKTPQPSA